MEREKNSPSNSISDVLDSLSEVVGRSDRECIGPHEDKHSKEVFLYPFVERPETLKLVPFYGDMPMYLIHAPTLTVPVVDEGFERPHLFKEIQDRARRCVDSIPKDAQAFGSLAMDFSNVIFGVRKIIQRTPDSSAFMAPSEDREHNFSREHQLSLYSMGHHHQAPSDSRILQLLCRCGAIVKNVKPVPETTTIRLKSSSNKSERHRLRLNSALEFLSWETQEWDPMKCHLVSTHRSGFGLLLRSRVRRHMTKEDIDQYREASDPAFPEDLAKPNLGGLLVRRGLNTYVIKKSSCIKSLYRIHSGKSYELELNGVSFKFETISWSEYRFLSENTTSFLIARGHCKSQLSFPITNDVELLSEAAATISMQLLRAIRNNSLQLSAVSFRIPVEGQVASIDCQALQKLRRLKFENGTLHQLLGLPENAPVSAAKINCLLVMRLMRNYKPMVMQTLSLRAQELERKLSDAASRMGIFLDGQKSSRVDKDKRRERSDGKWRDTRVRRSFSPLWWRRDH